jgi:hypothetical protein
VWKADATCARPLTDGLAWRRVPARDTDPFADLAAQYIGATLGVQVERWDSAGSRRFDVGDRNRYQRAIVELHRNLLVTTAGVQERRSGWPSALIELTCRRFDVGDRHDLICAAGRYLDTMLQATPAEMARAFRWPVAQARARLDELVSRGWAWSDGVRYVARNCPATQEAGPSFDSPNSDNRSAVRPRSGP